MRKQTWCEPVYRNGYWLVEIIDEFVPNWLQRVMGKKPWTHTHQYTNIDSGGQYRPFTHNWRHQPSGSEVGGLFDDMHYSLSRHVDKHLDRMRLEGLQEKEIRRDQG